LNRLENYLESIRNYYPELSVDKAEWLGFGQNNEHLLIGSELVFRFPKYGEGIEQLKREVDLLRCIAEHVPLQIPLPLYRKLAADERGRAFIGYRLIEGEPLEREVLQRIADESQLRQLAGQLGGFLKALHRLDARGLVGHHGVAEYRGDAEWIDLYERIREKLYPHMKQEARSWTDRHFTSFLGNAEHFAFMPSIIHGDFGTSNILYDPANGRISGIIDFGSAGIGDPAVDYAALLASYGEDFFKLLIEENPGIGRTMNRVRFYTGTFALQEALFGLEYGDDGAFRSGMESLDQLKL